MAKYEINRELFKSESLGNQMIEIRRYLEKEYSIRYISSFLLIDGKKRVFLLDSNLEYQISLDNIPIDQIQIRVGKTAYLQDSKKRKIRSRYSIPLEINDKKILIVLEDKVVNKFDYNNSQILQFIDDILMMD